MGISLGSMNLGTTSIFNECINNDDGDDDENDNVFALGNPCDFDLESVTKRSRNGFDPFHVSWGRLVTTISANTAKRKGVGTLIHSCWTYWGHSGCPLVHVIIQGERDDGDDEDDDDNNNNSTTCTENDNDMKAVIVGIHNSWDDSNCNRHGIPLNIIRDFIRNHQS